MAVGARVSLQAQREVGAGKPDIVLRPYRTAIFGIGIRKVDLKALDHAYSIAFPHSTPINVNKKRRGSSLAITSPSNVSAANVNKQRRQALYREADDEDDPP